MSHDGEHKSEELSERQPTVVEITATDVRDRLGEMIDRTLAGDRVVISRHGKTIAALIGAQDFDRLRAA